MVDMHITSTSFSDGSEIPRKYGYKNGNISPPLRISELPDNTKSLILIVDDPDAKKAVGKVWTHWILFNIIPWWKMSYAGSEGGTDVDPNTGNLEIVIPESKKGWTDCLTKKQWDQAVQDEIQANREQLAQNREDHIGSVGMLGLNSWDEFAYGGPAPPDAPHTYQFKVYALDEEVDESLGMKGTQTQVEHKMKEHIIAEAKLTGTYAP